MRAKFYSFIRCSMIAFFLLVLIVPTIHRFYPFFEEVSLVGVRKVDSAYPKFTMDDW